MPESWIFRTGSDLGSETLRAGPAGSGGRTIRVGVAPRIALAALLAAALTACAFEVPKGAFELSSESLQRRQNQTRVFDTADEAQVLAAAGGVLQDLGFTIDGSETDLGLIVASKRRDATEVGDVAISFAGWLIRGIVSESLGVEGLSEDMPVDDEQVIRASLVTGPAGESGGRMAVRVTLQRVVWDTAGDISRRESIDDPQIYQEFFEALSHSIFLEAHKI